MIIDFNNPFNTRKWLKLMETDSRFGLLFKSNLKVKTDYIGFNFKSNHLGLKGPCDLQGANTIIGTSFGMGMSVNDGDNWYDNKLFNTFFNVAFPNGLRNQIRILKDYHKGNKTNLFVIYHPNFWLLSYDFIRSEELGIDIFKLKGWKTDLLSAMILKVRKKIRRDNFLITNYRNKAYRINSNYCLTKSSIEEHYIQTIMEDFSEISSEYKNTIVYRVPVKEQLVNSKHLFELKEDYKKYWDLFKKIETKSNITYIDCTDKFNLSDYHQLDTHWNEKGNLKFQKIFLQSSKKLISG